MKGVRRPRPLPSKKSLRIVKINRQVRDTISRGGGGGGGCETRRGHVPTFVVRFYVAVLYHPVYNFDNRARHMAAPHASEKALIDFLMGRGERFDRYRNTFVVFKKWKEKLNETLHFDGPLIRSCRSTQHNIPFRDGRRPQNALSS